MMLNFGRTDFDHDTKKFLEMKYSESYRRYHGTSHINDMMKLAYGNSHITQEMILLHDVIYVPGATDNEIKSAEIAKMLELHYGDIVCRGIVQSANHWEWFDDEPVEIQFFLDYDIWDLGTPYYEVFAQNTKKLKMEYCLSKTPGTSAYFELEKEFDKGRKKWLTTVSNKSKHFRKHTQRDYNVNKNIERALKEF